MRFLICGEDGYRARRHLAQLRARFAAERDPGGLNQAVFQVDSAAALDEALTAIFAAPFMAERKLVVLESSLTRLDEAEQRRLAEALERQPETAVIVFFEAVGADALGKSPLFPGLKSEKFTVEFPPLTAVEATNFIFEAARDGGCGIEPDAARKLVALVGPDTWRLSNETAKLAALTKGGGRKTIAAADVEANVAGGREESIFEFIDACTAGAGGRAVTALDHLLAAGTAEMQVIAMLQKHFRTLICAREFVDAGTGEAEAAARLGVHPFVAQKALAAARRFSADFLRGRYRDLVEIERSFKTGAAKPRALVEIFAARLAAACAARR